MYFELDNQTLNDLRVFANREQAGILDIFNQTHTRGGEKLLREMFEQPLSNASRIRQRISILSFIADNDVKFPFDSSLFDICEKYIEYPISDSFQDPPLGDKEIQNGVDSMVRLFHELRNMVQKRSMTQIPGFTEHLNRINSVLELEELRPVFEEKSGSRLSYAAITAFDRLFRLTLRIRILNLLQEIYYIDTYTAVARVARTRKFTFPLIHEKGTGILRIKGVYHPELTDPVPNDITMDSEDTVIFLTGANMAGKSTLLRSIATAIYLAHMGFPIAAQELEISVMDGMYTTINLPDNLGIGASHFYAEVLRVKKVAAELQKGKAIFVIFDELFRGTNVKDAHEASVDVTISFAEHTNSRFIISSHIVEAAEQLQNSSRIKYYYLPTTMIDNRPIYTYTLMPGVTDDRHGMLIIRNEGILDILKNGKKRAISHTN